MAKKYDKFGWDRERGSKSQDRLISDWIDVLCDYPLDEVQRACKRWVEESPNRMPNEGHIRALIQAERKTKIRKPRTVEERKGHNPAAAQIIAEFAASLRAPSSIRREME